MICNSCGAESKGVVCVPCRISRTRAGLLLHQRRFVETFLKGSMRLRVREKAGAAHIELFDDRWHTYCDIELFDVAPNPELRQEIGPDVCAECRRVFDGIAEQVIKAGGRIR